MSWTTELDDDGNVKVTIEGYLGEEDGVNSVAALVARLGSRPRDVILEVGKMTGYRRNVRTTWQTALLTERGRIRRFVLVGGNSVIRMGFTVMAMSLNVPLTVQDPATHVDPDAPVRRGRPRTGSRSMTRPMSKAITRPAPAPTEAPPPPTRERSWGGLLIQRMREGSRPN